VRAGICCRVCDGGVTGGTGGGVTWPGRGDGTGGTALGRLPAAGGGTPCERPATGGVDLVLPPTSAGPVRGGGPTGGLLDDAAPRIAGARGCGLAPAGPGGDGDGWAAGFPAGAVVGGGFAPGAPGIAGAAPDSPAAAPP